MSDPRNVAHNKKVAQEKEHEQPKAGASSGRKSRKAKQPAGSEAETAAEPTATEAPKQEPAPGELEKSIAVLSKLKEMEFHSKANIATLAELTLAIEDELKQRDFVEPIGVLYSAQDGFETKIAALIESYEAHCESLKQTA